MSAFARLFLHERLRISPLRKGIVDLVEMDDSMSSFRAICTREIDFQTVANGETNVPRIFGRPRARALPTRRGARSRDEKNVRRETWREKRTHVHSTYEFHVKSTITCMQVMVDNLHASYGGFSAIFITCNSKIDELIFRG